MSCPMIKLNINNIINSKPNLIVGITFIGVKFPPFTGGFRGIGF